MPDILTTSLTGLTAYQSALATTSHNIANVGTEGYSRQDVELSTRTPLRVGDEFIGQGVLVDDVRRIVNDYVSANIREFTSSTSRMEIFEELSSRVESLVSNEQGGLMPAMDR
ncbi:MAG: flagellar basal body protein, partial [Gammaproteobacteria bacterium]|nr:flagellar basal body protein [Gammaproteobacteria bacterium]